MLSRCQKWPFNLEKIGKIRYKESKKRYFGYSKIENLTKLLLFNLFL